MADEGAGQPFPLEIGRLERQESQQVVQEGRDLARPARPPRPDRRRHVMDEGDAGALQALGDAEAEVGRVDGHHNVGPPAPDLLRRLLQPPDQVGQPGQKLGDPHQRQLVKREQAFQPLGDHAVAADPGEADRPVGLPLHGRHQARAEQIAGRLAGDQKDQWSCLGTH